VVERNPAGQRAGIRFNEGMMLSTAPIYSTNIVTMQGTGLIALFRNR